MPLKEYRRKRDFARTPEPPPRTARKRKTQLAYLIQKHDATRLHYDFRLEWEGVLLSWAVTKGPSLDPKDKRLAVRTEDHPLSYGKFEGTIPKGEYGGGTVMLWDQGTWEPKQDPKAGLKKGHLSFTLQGERLKGDWSLIRMRGDVKRENWLLVKERDAEARRSAAGSGFLEKNTSSVATGRSMEEIATGAKTAKKAGPATLTVAGVTITHPDRVISDTGHITKGELAEYYGAVAKFMLPEIVRRPLSLLRCPEGIGKECFYQRKPGRGLGKGVFPFEFRYKGKTYEYLYIEDERGLLDLVQMGAIEIHPWGARIDSIDKPDRVIFDLDPAPGLDFDAVRNAAQDIRARLAKRGLKSSLRCTGGKGLHVWARLDESAPWAEVKEFAGSVAREMVEERPDLYVATMTKAKRAGRIFVDFFRNDYTATAIADYAVRARAGAPVALPLDWKELPKLKGGDQFTIRDVLTRVESKRKPPTSLPPQKLP